MKKYLESEMNNAPLLTPVLFLIFNRPDTTQQVFNEIRKTRPNKLFIAADGPRKNNSNDVLLCQHTRDIVNLIDWDCEVHTLFRNENLGCKLAVSSAIDWFFSHVDEGIILEDDCLPDQSFFLFCQELLERFRNDERIMMITGTNYLFNQFSPEESYFFSKYYIIWGWATWKRAWELYDISMANWPKFQKTAQLEWIYSDPRLINWYTTMFQMAYDEKIDTWDIQWWYSCIFQNGLCIVPKHNLISNLGLYGHFSKSGEGYEEYIQMPIISIDATHLTHPSNVIENGVFDKITIHRLFYKPSGIKYKLITFVNKFLNKISIKISY